MVSHLTRHRIYNHGGQPPTPMPNATPTQSPRQRRLPPQVPPPHADGTPTPTPRPRPPDTHTYPESHSRSIAQHFDPAVNEDRRKCCDRWIHHRGQCSENGAYSRAGSFPGRLCRIPCQDPTLELHQGSSVIASNDNWQDTPNVCQIPSGFEPADSRESVIIATLSAGTYTVIQSSKDLTGGIGLLEIYDIDSAGDASLANISTRGLVQIGNEIMVGGFILEGGTLESTVVCSRNRAVPHLFRDQQRAGRSHLGVTRRGWFAHSGQRQLERRASPGRRTHGDVVRAG